MTPNTQTNSEKDAFNSSSSGFFYYLSYFFIYTLLFVLITGIISIAFIRHHRTLIWGVDGVPQYMLWMKYTGQYLREFVQNLKDGIFHVKMYDFNIGMGNDVKAFFKHELIGFLSIFQSGESTVAEYYSLLSILRVYLAGIAFSLYGFYMKKERVPILVGTFAYVFSSYTFYQVQRHPQFCVPLIMLPLLLLALERLMQRKQVLLYSLFVAINCICSYYFLYMNTIIMGIYVLLRIRNIYPKHTIKEFFLTLWRIIYSYLIGIAIASVSFLPTISGYVNSSRSTISSGFTDVSSVWYYSPFRICEIVLGMISPTTCVEYNTCVGMVVVIIPAILLLLFDKRKELLSLKIGTALCTLFMLMPVFGYIFSGFSAVINRWSYAFIFVMALVLLYEFENFFTWKWWQYILMVAILIPYYYGFKTARLYCLNIQYYIGAIFYVVTILIFLIIQVTKKFSPNAKGVLVCILVIISAAANGFAINDSYFGGFASEFVTEHNAENHFQRYKIHYLANIEDEQFHRSDSNMVKSNYNNNMAVALGYNGINFYNSTINGAIIDHYLETENCGISGLNRILSLDGRASQEAIACVKYYLTQKVTKHKAPYGFVKNEELSKDCDSYAIYENQYQLPIGYTYDSYITREDYNKLSAIEKQEIQLQSAVIEDSKQDLFEEFQRVDSYHGMIEKGNPVKILDIEGPIFYEHKDGTHTFLKDEYPDDEEQFISQETVEKDKDSGDIRVRISLNTRKNCEVYLRFVNLKYTGKERSQIKIVTDCVPKSIITRRDKDTYSVHQENFMMNLGYYKKNNTIKGSLRFSMDGTYSWDDIEVYYVHMDDYASKINQLKKDALEDITVDDDIITGTLNAKKDQILVYSIPYSPGWKAYVDGDQVNVQKINTMYLGFPVKAGQHDIVLKYISPGINIGAVLSIIGIILFLIILISKPIIQRKKRKEAYSHFL